MQFTTPFAGLILIIALPVIWYVGFPRHAFRRRRDISSLILRTVIVLLLVLALAGLQDSASSESAGCCFPGRCFRQHGRVQRRSSTGVHSLCDRRQTSG